MAAFWDARAREDAQFYVDDRGLPDAAFWAQGEEVVARFEADLRFRAAGQLVVEVGCGVGRVTRALAARAGTVAALDVSGEMLARARAANRSLDNVQWLHGDGHTLAGVGDSAADGVFSHVVFQHIPDPGVTLGYVAEMGRVLRSGGWAAFQVSDDPRVHRRRLRARRGSRKAAWRGSAVDLAALRETARAADLSVEAITGEGTQFCLIRLSRA